MKTDKSSRCKRNPKIEVVVVLQQRIAVDIAEIEDKCKQMPTNHRMRFILRWYKSDVVTILVNKHPGCSNT